ncbi:hypothetical protein CC86DRAFT_466300 [Ophiobolus disseminans]|uniref:Uncharacterized protein n=1 Tax=Ophiobolus disseminans TaxID=1469910 RepID=A0A6A7A4N8_9PLEO|nr:hypothetical protein CC86DRAFT_466300 [Ophiobolus disseminans]
MLHNTTLARATHLTWIVGHGSTLRTLHLTNCPVIVEIYTNMELDKDWFPIYGRSAGEAILYRIIISWAIILTAFISNLTHLRNVQISFLRTEANSEEFTQGMIAGRYKVYERGQIVTNAYSKTVYEDSLAKDTEAYIMLLKHTGQWRSEFLDGPVDKIGKIGNEGQDDMRD